jgi:hypothetical protein
MCSATPVYLAFHLWDRNPDRFRNKLQDNIRNFGDMSKKSYTAGNAYIHMTTDEHIHASRIDLTFAEVNGATLVKWGDPLMRKDEWKVIPLELVDYIKVYFERS